MLDQYLVVGEVLKPQGVRGEIKVRPITCDPMRFARMKQAYLARENGYEPVAVRCVRIDPDAVYLTVEGIRDREQAEKLRGQLLYVDRAHAVKLPEDTEFICDLVGCRAAYDEGNDLGVLTEVLQPGAGDVYVFRGPRGEVLVPALKRAVLQVSVAEKKILLSAQALREVAVFEEA